MEEIKFILTTPHGSQIEISKKANSETITLQYRGVKQRVAQTFNNVDELSEYLKRSVFGPIFRNLL